MGIKQLIFPLLAAFILAGCGLKPRREPIPSDVSIKTVLEALQRQAKEVDTFSGWAKIQVRERGEEESTNAIIAYQRHERYKITLLGFGGAVIAEISSTLDSVTAYIPYYNGYIRTPKGVNPLGALLPEFADIDLARLISVVSGTPPPPDALENYAITLRKWEHQAELVLEREGMQYRYLVRGPQLLAVEETISYKGETVWHVVRSDFRRVNGVSFPRRIQVQDGRRTLRLDFSGFSINTGLREEELAIILPEDAERLTVPK